MSRRLATNPLVLIAAGATGAWLLLRYLEDPTGHDIVDLSWQEPVQLSSRESITVSRELTYSQSYSLGIRSMTAKVVTHSSVDMLPPKADFPRWEAPALPILIDRDPTTKEWILIAGEEGTELWWGNGMPCPPHWAFRLRLNTWYVEPVPEWALGRTANLLVDFRSEDDRRLRRGSFQETVPDRKAAQQGFTSSAPKTLKEIRLPYPDGYSGHSEYCKRVDRPAFTHDFQAPAGSHPSLMNFPPTPE